jgi:DNA-binding XRE family transcriptional regulator
MESHLTIDPHRLTIFHELKKRRIYVGELLYDAELDAYKLIYDENYINSKSAIPLSPELSLFKKTHTSQKSKLFDAFVDRIPDRFNPAYTDYCHSQGISVDERNPIILLGSIGRRGPSTFIFEKMYKTSISLNDIINLRNELSISQNDFAKAFDISEVTLQKIETGISHDSKTIKLLQIYLTFPEVAIWQLYQTGAAIHTSTLLTLIKYFNEKIKTTNIEKTQVN